MGLPNQKNEKRRGLTWSHFQGILEGGQSRREGYCRSFTPSFDKIVNNRTDKNLTTMTRIDFEGEDYIIPDAVFLLSSMEKERLFLFEMHNGSDTFRLLKQLHKHAYALVRKFTHKRFKYLEDKSYSTLLLFERERIKKPLLKDCTRKGGSGIF